MKKFIISAVTATVLVVAPVSFADSSLGFGVSSVGGDGVDFTGFGTDVSGRFNENFGYSISAQIGGSDDFEGIDFDLNYYVAAKLRGGLAVGNGFLYLTGGYGYVDVEGSLGGFSASESGNGAVYGVGFETFFEDSNWGIGFEFNTGSGDLDEADQILATMKYRF